MTRTELIARLRVYTELECSAYAAEFLTQAADMLEADGMLSDELERERMRLVACGVVAMSDTPDSAKKARDMHPDYKSASCDDVARRVDECIKLREAARLAFDVMVNHSDARCSPKGVEAIAALKKVLK